MQSQNTAAATSHPSALAHAADKPVTPERLMQFAWGYAIPLVIEAGVKNHVFDHLDGGAKTLDELSRATGASRRGLRPVLNTLVSINLLGKQGDGYTLTSESQTFLVSTKPSFQGGLFRHMSKQLIPKWLELSKCVATGQPSQAVNHQSEGVAFFEELVSDIFPMSYAGAQALGRSLEIQKTQTPYRVLDLATGSGVWGIAQAQLSPKVHVTAVDWPGVLTVTRRFTEKFNVASQFDYVAGDLASADFGSGYHLATLGHILHSEGESRSRRLLKKTFAALAPGGQISIAEFVANEDRTGPPNAMIFAVNMLVNTSDGDTFTFSQMKVWLTESGFTNVRQLEAPGPSPLILATKPA
jgi:ubiquinone/menaquinone biosynthesis C-methylase UbiE